MSYSKNCIVNTNNIHLHKTTLSVVIECASIIEANKVKQKIWNYDGDNDMTDSMNSLNPVVENLYKLNTNGDDLLYSLGIEITPTYTYFLEYEVKLSQLCRMIASISAEKNITINPYSEIRFQTESYVLCSDYQENINIEHGE